MSRLSSDRWRVLSPYLDQALELDGEERAAWLDSLRATDPALATDVEMLLSERNALSKEGFLVQGVPSPLGQASLTGQTMGAYTLLSLVGQGGMGSVWLAERSDGRFKGRAAIKLLHVASIGRAGEERFKREGSVLARLRHPHIAHLIDAGVAASGQPYLVLEHVEGQHIDRHCKDGALGIEARVRLFLDVLGAVAHAHANLIVHRDIKPSNVLVATDGQVKLLDFGIAKLLEADAGQEVPATRPGESALTPEFAAPEQLLGQDTTTATDVYALGVLLYVLLTGRHPLGADRRSPADLVRAIVDTEPVRPSDAVASDPKKLRRKLRGDLDNIIFKALKKRPSERYASAEAMADDLRRYLAHEPVRARADSLGYRARKFVVRHRLGLAAAATAVLALVTGTTVAVWQARAAARQRDRALVQLQRAEATNDLTSFLLAEARPQAGRPITNAELLERGAALIDHRFADDPRMRVHMLLTLADRYQENQQFDRWGETLERAFEASRGIPDDGLRSRAACARALSLSERGDHAAADALLAEALGSLASLPDAARDEAHCRVYESIVSSKKGDYARAVVAAERAVALERQPGGQAGSELEVDALAALGNAYSGVSRFASSDDAFRRLFALLEAQGRGKTRHAAAVLNNWSAMLQIAGQYEKAVPLSERAIGIARAQDSEKGAMLSQLTTYGGALTIVGRFAEAIPIQEEAIAKARAAGSPLRLFFTLASASAAYREAGDLERTDRLLSDAEALLRANASFPAHLHGLLDRHWARLALVRGDAGQALQLAQRALARHEEAKRPVSETLPVVLVLAEAQNAAGQHDAALAMARRALAIANERLGELKHSYHVGQARLQLGIAHAGLANLDDASAELQEAVDHLRSTVGLESPTTRRAMAELGRLGS